MRFMWVHHYKHHYTSTLHILAVLGTKIWICAAWRTVVRHAKCKEIITTNLSDIGGSVFLSVDLSTDGSSPAPTPHHRVHGWRNFFLTGIWPRARLLLGSHLLSLLLLGNRHTKPHLSCSKTAWLIKIWIQWKSLSLHTYADGKSGEAPKSERHFCIFTAKQRCNSLPWSSRNVEWTTKLHLTSHQHESE